KIVVNMGVGDSLKDGRLLDAALEDLTTVTGQKPLTTKARKSIAGFKLREGMAIGAKVTLRGDRMWEFLDRLLSTALPRIREFGVRESTRCRRCGRARAVFRKFMLCRICLRELSHAGEVPGVTKASW